MKAAIAVIAVVLGIVQSNVQLENNEESQQSVETCARKAVLFERLCKGTALPEQTELASKYNPLVEDWYDMFGPVNRAAVVTVFRRFVWLTVKGERKFDSWLIAKPNGKLRAVTMKNKIANAKYAIDKDANIRVSSSKGNAILRLQASSAGRLRLRVFVKDT